MALGLDLFKIARADIRNLSESSKFWRNGLQPKKCWPNFGLEAQQSGRGRWRTARWPSQAFAKNLLFYSYHSKSINLSLFYSSIIQIFFRFTKSFLLFFSNKGTVWIILFSYDDPINEWTWETQHEYYMTCYLRF